jgi:hypothetical protein
MAAGAGCALFYDLGTGGYSLASDGGTGAGDCGADAACPSFVVSCLGAGDCDAGMVCCLALEGGAALGAQSACSVGPCGGPVPVQLCRTSTECTQGSCVLQTCAVGTNTAEIGACGLQAFCTQ